MDRPRAVCAHPTLLLDEGFELGQSVRFVALDPGLPVNGLHPYDLRQQQQQQACALSHRTERTHARTLGEAHHVAEIQGGQRVRGGAQLGRSVSTPPISTIAATVRACVCCLWSGGGCVAQAQASSNRLPTAVSNAIICFGSR